MVTLFYGQEPWLRDQAIQSLSDKVENPDLNISRFEGYSVALANACDQLPCFADYRLIICEEPEKTEFPKGFFESISETTYLLLVGEKMDKRKTLYKTLTKLNATREFVKLSRHDVLQHIVIRSGLQSGLAEFLLERSGYLVNEHVTLYDLENEILKVKGIEGITKEHIELLVNANPSEDIFRTTQMVLDGDTAGAIAYARSLCERKISNPIGLISLMLRIYRIAYKARLNVGKSRSELAQLIGADPRTLQQVESINVSTDVLHRWIGACNDAVLSIKNGRMPDDIALDHLICTLQE